MGGGECRSARVAGNWQVLSTSLCSRESNHYLYVSADGIKSAPPGHASFYSPLAPPHLPPASHTSVWQLGATLQ